MRRPAARGRPIFQVKNLNDNQGLRAAEMARVLGVDRRTFERRAKRHQSPRLPGGLYDVATTRSWWWKTSTGNGHGGARRGAGAKPRVNVVPSRDEVPPAHPEDLAVDVVVDELVATAAQAPRWDLALARAEPSAYGFTATEARTAIATVPNAEAWLQFALLEANADADNEPDACRRDRVAAALGWLIALHRRAPTKFRTPAV